MIVRESCDIAILGAGVIGLAIAERLLAEGYGVTLVDPGPPGGGASYGNAGTIADYAVMPVGTPGVLRDLPRLMFDRNSPLALRRSAIPALAPWLLRFLRQSLPGAAARNAQALVGLLADAAPLWNGLAERVGGAAILHPRGCLYLYETHAEFQAAAADMAHRRGMGVQVALLNAQEVAALEPGLPAIAGAAFFPQAVFMSDPGAMMARLAAHVLIRATLIQARAEKITRTGTGVTITGPNLHLTARRVIIAAGAHSRALAASAGDRIPLDTERGYHLEWDMPTPPLTRPACPTSRGFYLCPMQGRLRVAGTVELGGLTAPPSPHRLQRLEDGARKIFPHLGPPDRTWMGFRPSIPDSLPVIGASPHGAAVIHAFGHGHIGLTLAPVTARLVADLIAGRAPERDITAVRVNRF